MAAEKAEKGKPAKSPKKPCPGKSVEPPATVPAAESGVVATSWATPAIDPSPAVSASPAPHASPAESPSENGIVSAVSSFVRALAKEPPAAARPPAAAPKGLVLAGKGGHKSGGDWYSKGMELHHDERYDEAIAAFGKSIEAGYKEEASTYNIACGYALKGDKDRAFEWLHKAAEVGFPVAKYWSDDDLDSLHSDPRWAAMRKELRDNPSAVEHAERKHANDRLERLLADPKTSGSRFLVTCDR